MIGAVLLALACQTPAPAPADRVRESRRLQREAAAANEAGETPRFLAAARGASELRPQHMGLLLLLASAEALSGNKSAALAALTRVADSGWAADLADATAFGAVASDPEYARLAARLRANGEARLASAIAVELRDAGFCAEGIARDPADGAIFLSSFDDGRILRVRGAGAEREESEFAACAAAGCTGAYGLAVDPARRLLWACAGAARGEPGEAERGALLAFDLASGALVRRVRGGADDPRLLGDLAIAADGSVYATDPLGGAVVRLAPGAENFDSVLAPGHLLSPQGVLVLPPLGEEAPLLLVADYACGLYCWPDDGSSLPQEVKLPPGAALLGVDGLAWHDGALLAIVNGAPPARVLRLRFARARREITAIETLEAAHPRYGEPTLGVVAGNDLYYVANVPWADPARHPPALVLRLALR